jgi:nucleotide-binding universal stress UspA family protein
MKVFAGKKSQIQLNTIIAQNNADVLLVVKHKRLSLDSLFHKSKSYRITLHSKISVMVLREEKELGAPLD